MSGRGWSKTLYFILFYCLHFLGSCAVLRRTFNEPARLIAFLSLNFTLMSEYPNTRNKKKETSEITFSLSYKLACEHFLFFMVYVSLRFSEVTELRCRNRQVRLLRYRSLRLNLSFLRILPRPAYWKSPYALYVPYPIIKYEAYRLMYKTRFSYTSYWVTEYGSEREEALHQ